MKTRSNFFYAMWFLISVLLCMFSITMLLVIQGCPELLYALVAMLLLCQLFGLFYYLHRKHDSEGKLMRVLLKLDFLLSFLSVVSAVFFTLMMTSQFHKAVPDTIKITDGSQIDLELVSKAENTLVYETDALYILFPQYKNVEFVYKDRPSKSDSSITFCSGGTFTQGYSLFYRDNLVSGAFASNGEYHDGFYLGDAVGAFAFYNNEPHFTQNNSVELIKTAAKHNGNGFQQFTAMHDYEITRLTTNQLRCCRVLAEFEGRMCIIESKNPMYFYDDFSELLKKLGVKNALYLDMGAGWNYSWYRKNNKEPRTLLGFPFIFSKNWIVFRK